MSDSSYFAKEREFLKDIVLLLPAVHFLVCFVYLSIYFISFGGKLENFASPTDIFSVSFSNIVPFYFGFAIPQLLFATTNIKRYSGLPEDVEFEVPPYASTIRLILYILTVGILALAAIEYSVTRIFPVILFTIAILCPIVSWLPKILEKRSVHVREIVSGLTLGFVFLAANAAYQGQRDRYYPVAELGSSLSCRDFKIIRPLAQNFLAAHHGGQRAIINEECKVRAVVAKPPNPYVKTSDALKSWAKANLSFR